MGFLPLPTDDELTPEALAAFRARHGDESLSDLDRTLLGSVAVYEAYQGWYTLRDALQPLIGERAVTLFGLAISRAARAPYPTAFHEGVLRADGDDPDDPQVTDAERLLLEWGAAIGAGGAVSDELTGQVAETFQPSTRLLLTGFAGLMVAVCAFTVAAEL